MCSNLLPPETAKTPRTMRPVNAQCGVFVQLCGFRQMVDYSLLLTFVFFFVFAGNMARIDAVRDFFSALMDKNTLLYSALSCQVISNVPSAILLSQFTQNYAELLVIFSIFCKKLRSLSPQFFAYKKEAAWESRFLNLRFLYKNRGQHCFF